MGAAGLITGSTVGAGILALPQVTYEAGFAPSAALLLGSWAVLALEALLVAEVRALPGLACLLGGRSAATHSPARRRAHRRQFEAR